MIIDWGATWTLIWMAGCLGWGVRCWFDLHHREVWKPLVGTLLFRRFTMKESWDPMSLFIVANGHHRPKDLVEVDKIYWSLVDYIKRNSWFNHKDMMILNTHWHRVRRIIADEAVKRAQREYAYARAEYEKKYGKAQSSSKPKQKQAPVSTWRTVLGVSENERDPKVIKSKYRKAVMIDHPDRGGSGKKMPELTRAIDTARKELNFV